MIIQNVIEARFLNRPNRFIAICEIGGRTVTAHVRNTGRCRELLIPGVTVYLEASENQTRKTGYTLITVRKGTRLVNIDSLAPNRVMKEALERGGCILPELGRPSLVRSETRYGNSRFDFYLEAGNKKAFLEVKGVTLEDEGVALFPDAPTERGVKHIEELIRAKTEGYEAYLAFLVQMEGVRFFAPNTRMHPEFAEALKRAHEQGVHILCYDCMVSRKAIVFGQPVPVQFDRGIL